MLASTLALSAPLYAQSGEWRPELRPSQSGDFWLPGDPIVIYIPPEVPLETLQRLALELDNFDVTSLIQREGDLAVLRLPEPLATGEHRLRLVENAEDGSIIELGSWTFQVRQSEAFEELSASGNFGLDASQRLTGDNTKRVDKTVVTSAGDGNISVKEGGWHSSANANYLYNSEDQITIDGEQRHLDLGQYLLTTGYRNDDIVTEARLGYHDIGAQDFIMNNFQSRGASVTLGSADSRARVTGFAQASETVIGIDRISGVEDPDDRLQGGHLSFRPLGSINEDFEITGTFYQGEDNVGGDNEFSIDEQNDGHGWSVAMDSLWLDRRLRVRTEMAQTRFDFDGRSGAIDSETDEAYSGLVTYEILRDLLVDESPLRWNVGLQHEQLGFYFKSLGNQGNAPDRKTTSLFTDVSWEGFAFQGIASYQTNNVNSLEGFGRDETVQLQLDGFYTPFPGPDDEPLPDWLGAPSFGLNFTLNDSKLTDIPNPLFLKTESQVLGTTASFNTSYETWSWGISQSVNAIDDETGGDNDFISFLTGLNANVQVGDYLSLQPGFQWSLSDFQGQSLTVHNLVPSLSGQYTILPGTLDGSFNYTYNMTRGQTFTQDSHTLGGSLDWTFLEPEINRPGARLSLTGSLTELTGRSFGETDDRVYQVFLKLHATLPAQY